MCYYRHDASRSNCSGKALPNFNVPYSSVSRCHWVSVIELIIPYFHYLGIFHFRIYCSDEWETHLVNSCGEMKTKSGFVRFPACGWEVPELSGRWRLLCGGAKLTRHVPSGCHILCTLLSKHWVILCFQLPAKSVTWSLLPNGFNKGGLMLSLLSISLFLTHFTQTFSIFVVAKHIYIKWAILVKIFRNKIKALTQAFSETK